MQSLDLGDNHLLCRHPRGIAGRQRAGDLLQMLQSRSDMEPVQNRPFGNARIGENASKSRTSIGESRQFGAFRSDDGVEARLISTVMFVSAFATVPKTCRALDFVSTLPNRTFR